MCSMSVMDRLCFQKSSAAAQVRSHSMQTNAFSKEATHQESSADPAQRILMKAINHIPEHGYAVFRTLSWRVDVTF